MRMPRAIAFVTLSLLSLTVVRADGQLLPERLKQPRAYLLCDLTNCSAPSQPPPSLPPKIDDVQGKFTPGSQVLVGGSGFGTTPGKLVLRGQLPGGPVELTGLNWHDTYVQGTVPSVSGVLDHNATVYLITAGGMQSNGRSIPFAAEQDIRFMKPVSAMQVLSCGRSDATNFCRVIAGYWIQGSHTVEWITASGTDVYSVSLKNGWVFDHIIENCTDIAGTIFPFACIMKGFSKDVASITLIVEWGTPFLGGLEYHPVIYIRGPKGVPYE